jgi:hypothetical protein
VGHNPVYQSKEDSVLMILTDDFGFLEEKREVDIEEYPCGL